MSPENRQLLAQAARRALDLFRRRIAVGQVALPQIKESVLAQLEWLVDFAEGRSEQRARLADLTFGLYVAKDEFDSRDVELSDALSKAFYAADTFRRGLKIDAEAIASTLLPNTSLERTREQ